MAYGMKASALLCLYELKVYQCMCHAYEDEVKKDSVCLSHFFVCVFLFNVFLYVRQDSVKYHYFSHFRGFFLSQSFPFPSFFLYSFFLTLSFLRS